MNQASCLCGAVRYAITLPFTTMAHCHCSMCRKHHGAPFATFAVAPVEAFRWIAGEDVLGTYRSSERGTRTFCTICGSVGPALMPGEGIVVVPAGNLEGDPNVRPEHHMFATSKASWYEITDSLPQHAGFPAEYGGGAGVERPVIQSSAGGNAGSCLCGQVAYQFDVAQRMVNCHCSRCRRGRSAAHTTNVFAKLDGFRWTRGEVLVVDYKVPEARYFAVAFCRHCGGGLPRISVERGIAVIPAGTLDTDPGLRPQMHIFVGSRAPWYEITDNLPQFEAMPPG